MFLRDVRYCPKWMIHLSPDAHLSLDLVSDVPKWVTFLIRQEYSKYSTKAGGFKFDLLQFGRFDVLLDPFLEAILIL